VSDHADQDQPGTSDEWVELTFTCSREQADLLSDALIALGAPSVQVTDANENTDNEEAIFGEPGSEDPYRGWRESRLTLMAADASQARAMLEQACDLVDLPIPDPIAITTLAQQDWVRTTQAQFDPIPVGSRLWITPSWHGSVPVTDDRISITLDPGLAFGTGSHPTTSMCLQWLDANPPVDRNVIDYGCGSGILGIAALKLGARQVTAIDIDEQALISSEENARINGVRMQLQTTREPMPPPVPVVLANILAGPLKVLAPLLQELVEPGGELILAGLLDSQVEDVSRAYPMIDLQPFHSLNGWTCLSGRKR
jgi:ribosomal protein L11 methyltransferase